VRSGDPDGSRSGPNSRGTEAKPGRKASEPYRPRAAGAMRGFYPWVTPSRRIFQIQTELRVNTALSICLRHSCLVEQSASPSLPEEDFGSLKERSGLRSAWPGCQFNGHRGVHSSRQRSSCQSFVDLRLCRTCLVRQPIWVHRWLGAVLGDCAFSISARHKLKNALMIIATIGPLELAGLVAAYASTSRTRTESVELARQC
jgi:hypothetical protein